MADSRALANCAREYIAAHARNKDPVRIVKVIL